jgi:hypothetical protein
VLAAEILQPALAKPVDEGAADPKGVQPKALGLAEC